MGQSEAELRCRLVTTGARAPEAPPVIEAAAPTDSHARRFRGDIQVLRAVAVLLVVASHVTGVPEGGFIGVDVFFVLSGYFVTGMLLVSADRRGAVGTQLRPLLPAHPAAGWPRWP